MKPKATTDWFPGSVTYQIYPRSFYDTNGDGVGDLRGIIEKLDYLRGTKNSLGVDAVWISPFFKSPMQDFGYDISDFCAVDALFGNMADFDELLEKAHARGLRVMIDLVPNHTSSQHPWFQEAKSSKQNPKRDWYVWADPDENGHPPSNWLSVFGGSAWEFDKASGQYYLHTFLPSQPDLNWQNPEVRRAIQNVMRFWFDKGVDGFRIDSVYWLSKDYSFQDDPPNPYYDPSSHVFYDSLLHICSREGPKLYAYLQELADTAAEYGDKVLVTEAYPEMQKDQGHYLRFYQNVNPKVLSPFNFNLIHLPWQAVAFKRYIDYFQAQLTPDYTPVYVLGNHDSPRVVSRIGLPQARAAAVMQLCLPGAQFIYYGEELGMENVDVPLAKNHDPVFRTDWGNKPMSRDPVRTPMQWSNDQYAGFSSVEPWLPVDTDFRSRNVGAETQNPASMLSLYRKLIKLRHNSPALCYGSYEPLDTQHSSVYGFSRRVPNETLAILINFGAEPCSVQYSGKIIISSVDKPKAKTLQAYEGRVVRIENGLK